MHTMPATHFQLALSAMKMATPTMIHMSPDAIGTHGWGGWRPTGPGARGSTRSPKGRPGRRRGSSGTDGTVAPADG